MSTTPEPSGYETEPLVSVVMPARNADAYVDTAVESILHQTYHNLELLVADDASTDQTRAVIDALPDPRIRRIHSDERLGYLRACNRLFEHARGSLITFQDADDVSHSQRLEKQVRLLLERPDLGLCGTWARLVDAQGAQVGTDRRPVEDSAIRRTMQERNPFCGATILVRRTVMSAVGGYREAFHRFSFQDYDWAWRLIDHSHAENIPEELYDYRQHAASNSKQISVERAIGDSLVRELARQRREQGHDCLERDEPAAFERTVEELSRPYLLDPALLHREYAARFLWAGFHAWAMRRAFAALRMAPMDLRNLRLVLYCARHIAFSRLGRVR